MVHNLVHNLCESLVTNIGDIVDTGKRTPPIPITYLTQWRMMGNSVVHTDEYLTQWKVEGNSVVDNNAILSCGDLGQDGYYHVKISNGVDVFDIALTEPLRKVNDVADNIELINGVATLTRKIASTKWNDCVVIYQAEREYKRFINSSVNSLILKPTDFFESVQMCLSSDFIQNNAPLQSNVETNPTDLCMAVYTDGAIYIRDTSTTSVEDFYEKYGTHELLYRLATPTTETIQVSPFPVSPTDTYTSANDTPYSAFEYKKNIEIWSCGEYSVVDGKYHILVQPLGGSIADIALDEPLRKVNNVADSIEYADGVATLTRNLASNDMGIFIWTIQGPTTAGDYRFRAGDLSTKVKKPSSSSVLANVLCAYDTITASQAYSTVLDGIGVDNVGVIYLFDSNYNHADALDDFKAHIQGAELIYEVATPTTETIQVPQIEEADSYTCVISQGGKAVSWSSFETE